jgi:hypothetical protein
MILFKFLMKKLFNIQKILHHKSKHHETKLMHPSLLRAFQRDQECNLKHPNSVDLKTKQTTFLHRLISFYYCGWKNPHINKVIIFPPLLDISSLKSFTILFFSFHSSNIYMFIFCNLMNFE